MGPHYCPHPEKPRDPSPLVAGTLDQKTPMVELSALVSFSLMGGAHLPSPFPTQASSSCPLPGTCSGLPPPLILGLSCIARKMGLVRMESYSYFTWKWLPDLSLSSTLSLHLSSTPGWFTTVPAPAPRFKILAPKRIKDRGDRVEIWVAHLLPQAVP